MISEELAAQMDRKARIGLLRNLGKNEEAVHLAEMLLVLLEDRAERERYCNRLSRSRTSIDSHER